MDKETEYVLKTLDATVVRLESVMAELRADHKGAYDMIRNNAEQITKLSEQNRAQDDRIKKVEGGGLRLTDKLWGVLIIVLTGLISFAIGHLKQ